MSRFFGRTCAGRAQRAALLALLGLALALTPVSPVFAAGPSAATATPTSVPLTSVYLSLGFGPTSLYPVSQGTPVYTAGDTMWALSAYNYTLPIALLGPQGSSTSATGMVASRDVLPDSITPLYTFAANDADGIWNVTLQTTSGPVIIPVRFVNLASHAVSLGPLSYSLDSGNLSISTQANLGDTYDQQVCTAGSATASGVGIPVPASTGDKGNVTLVPGATFDVKASGNFSQAVSFWFELYHPYALDVTSANSLVVNNILVATSTPVTITASGTQNTTVAWSAAMREGRYDARLFFQTTTGLQVAESQVLILNSSSWISLTNQCIPQPVTSNSISYSTTLTTGQQNWPKTVYFMYRTNGVEGVASYPVSAELSSIDFIAAPWNQTINDITVSVTPQAGVQTSQEGNALFILADKYPVDLSYSLGINGGTGISQGSAYLPTDNVAVAVSVKLAKLTVNVVSNQPSATNLVVTGPGGINIAAGLTGTNETDSFLLPTGSYSLSATQAGNTANSQVSLVDGTAASVTLNFNTFTGLEIILVVTAAMAAIANLLVWIYRSRGIVSKVAPKQP